MEQHYHTVLTIAGSDSSGGAGVQADIKSICANGGYAASVVTATTAQNTCKVTDIHPVPIAHLIAQMEAVLSDIKIDAVKIGMLHAAETIDAVQRTLAAYTPEHIVLDPVMVATSGDRLMDGNAIERLKEFFPDVTLITPNIPEASLLLDKEITRDNMAMCAKELGERYCVSVLLKGGHLPLDEVMTDILYHYRTKEIISIKNPMIKTNNLHGTGCTLSSAIATYLARGEGLEEAVMKGSRYLNQAIEAGKERKLGKGAGPVNHFFVL